MKAFVVEKYGPDGLRATDVPEPRVGPRDVLVEVAAASVNPLDKMVRNGEFKQLLRYKTPFALGHDVAGVVSAVGAEVTGFAVGDEVFSRPRDLRIGTFAERIAIDQADLAHKPISLSMTEAAAVPLVALAAKQSLVDVAGLRSGQRVLVHAGAGGLGATVVQYAKHLGAHVTVTASGADEAKVHDLGADEVIDYRSTDFAAVSSGFDVVLDSLGGANLEKSLTVLRPGGLAISVVGPPDPAFADQLGRPLLKPVMAALSWNVRRRARKRGVRYAFFFMHADGAALAELAELYDKGVLRPTLDPTPFTFDRTPEALAHVEQGRAKGKVVITMSGEDPAVSAAAPVGSAFAEVTRIEAAGPDRWSAELDPRWTIGGRPNGGYLLALLGRAATASSERAHVLSASAQYLRAPEPGPVLIEVEILRAGRGLTHLHATMRQHDQVCVTALLGTGELADDTTASWTSPDTPTPSPTATSTVRVPPTTPTGGDAQIMGQVVIDLDADAAGLAPDAPSGRGEIAGRLALPDGARFDDAALLYAIDALPPASFTVAASGWVPTLSMTAYVRALPAPGPVHIRCRAAAIDGGRVDETVWIHDAAGRLVAHGSQLAGIRLA